MQLCVKYKFRNFQVQPRKNFFTKSNFLMSEHTWSGEESSNSFVSTSSLFSDFLLDWSPRNMSHQAWVIADLPHRQWNLKYLPDEFRAIDIKDENHPYYSLLQTFDQLRDFHYYTDDIPVLISLEPRLKQIGQIIDKLIDLPGPYAKGIFDFTALSAYVHTMNDLWIKRNQLHTTPIWRQPYDNGTHKNCYNESFVYDPELLSQLTNISLILDWWLGKPQFDFWIGIIDLNFDTYSTQLEAYVHWYNAVFFPLIKDGENVIESEKDGVTKDVKKNDNEATGNKLEHKETDSESSESDSEEEIDIVGNDKDIEKENKKIVRRMIDDEASDYEWSSSSDF